MSGQHCENYDVKWETVHCYPRNVDRCCTWPDVVAGISARFSKFAFVLFCYITNRLMTGPLGNSEFCFPRISMFPSTSSRETLRFSGNKIHCSPRDQSLSVNCCMAGTSITVRSHGRCWPIKARRLTIEADNNTFITKIRNFWFARIRGISLILPAKKWQQPS